MCYDYQLLMWSILLMYDILLVKMSEMQTMVKTKWKNERVEMALLLGMLLRSMKHYFTKIVVFSNWIHLMSLLVLQNIFVNRLR